MPSTLGPTSHYGAIEPYFEFEALLASVIRYFATTRYLLWQLFPGGGGAPRNFRDTHAHCRYPSAELKDLVSLVCTQYETIKKYRDCVQHNAHFGAARRSVVIERRASGVRVVRALIPDNPEVKSYRLFRYDRRDDALDLAHEYTNVCVGFAHLLWQALGAQKGDAP